MLFVAFLLVLFFGQKHLCTCVIFINNPTLDKIFYSLFFFDSLLIQLNSWNTLLVFCNSGTSTNLGAGAWSGCSIFAKFTIIPNFLKHPDTNNCDHLTIVKKSVVLTANNEVQILDLSSYLEVHIQPSMAKGNDDVHSSGFQSVHFFLQAFY